MRIMLWRSLPPIPTNVAAVWMDRKVFFVFGSLLSCASERILMDTNWKRCWNFTASHPSIPSIIKLTRCLGCVRDVAALKENASFFLSQIEREFQFFSPPLKTRGRNHINQWCKVIDIVFNDDVLVLLIKKRYFTVMMNEKNCMFANET